MSLSDLSTSPIEQSALEKLHLYGQLLFNASQQFNLTALRTLEDIETQLVAQSVRLADYLPEGCGRVIDIGSGGGIPGIPIAICRPTIDVTLIDATAKKIRFIDTTATKLELQNIAAIQGRVEELGRQPEYRESFDVGTARALAALPTLVEYTLPFIKVGGTALLPKGPDPQPEIELAREAIQLLGGALSSVILDQDLGGSLVVLSKVTPTPAIYPRRTGIPSKRPIGVLL